MYYLIVLSAVTMFAFQILFSERYENKNGNSFAAVLKFIITAHSTGFVIMFAMNKFRLELTPFSLTVAACAAINIFLFNICSIKSFSKINISLYSVICTLGGMVLPFLAGIFFYDEEITAGKILCIILIIPALILTVNKDNSKGGLIYYIGVFITNGMSGVYSKFYQSGNYEKASEAGYSLQIAAIAVIICAIMLIFVKDKKPKMTAVPALFASGFGVLNSIGNFLLLIGLTQLPASAQYPFVTGGIMIISTIICCFTKNKPGKRDFISVALSLIAILALVFIK